VGRAGEPVSIFNLDAPQLSSSLKIPDNILLIFQPPYTPELNPIERIWLHIKQELSWEISENLNGIKKKFALFLNNFQQKK
jgi:transposase